MAKSQQTFSKSEKEKKRLKKRLDKQKKMDARKADKDENGSTGIQFAYVDHNGNLTDTPPDPELKVEYELEDIQISVTKKEDLPEEDPVRKGKVSFFDTSKGFGFIIDMENNEKYFTHVSGLIDDIAENDKVSFELERGMRGMNAVKVTKIVIHDFLSGNSFKNIAPSIADNIGAIAIITNVFATLVFCIETTKVILVTEKVPM